VFRTSDQSVVSHDSGYQEFSGDGQRVGLIARVTQRRRTVFGSERSQANADTWSGGKSGVIEERLGAKLAGAMSWPDQKETPVKDL
jgi:hypothetical protein